MNHETSALLHRLQTGDSDAARALCQAYLPAVRCLALAGTLDGAGAGQVVAAVMQRALPRFAEASDARQALALVEELTREELRNHLRESGGRSSEFVALPAEAAARASGPTIDCSEVFGDLDEDRAAWTLLEAATWIPPHYEVLFLLRNLEGMDYGAIAGLAGISEAEVATGLASAWRLYERELGFHLKKVAAE